MFINSKSPVQRVNYNVPLTAYQIERWASGYGDKGYKPTTMNDMPVPWGSWANNHAQIQRKYNLILVAGTAFLGASIFAVSRSLFTLVDVNTNNVFCPRRVFNQVLSTLTLNLI